MGFNRPEAKRLAKAAMRNTNPNPMLVTLVFVLLTTGVSYLVGLVLTNPIYDALYTAYLYLLDGAYDPMFIFKSLLSPMHPTPCGWRGGSSRATGGCLTALQPWAGLFWSVC